MEKKQTAVEWLASQLGTHIIWEETIIDIIEQAKQMEREQIEDAIEYGFNYGCRYANGEEGECNSQPYYEQTYGGQDEEML
jgi:hypothetical protein